MAQPFTLSSKSKRRMATGGALGRLLDRIVNVWTGIFWAVLLFIYCSIGSAMPTVRQHAALEMTEFEWFRWWPFSVLVLLLCMTLILVTVRRIPLRLVNLGVWTIHSGIIVLCIGSYYYFGTKVEGDTPVFRRRIQIELPGMDGPQELLALPGNQTSAIAGGDEWRFQVQSTNTGWPILSDEHKGEKAYAVSVRVSPPNGEVFIRQLLAGYPQYTEDIIPGKGRAIKSIGRKLVEEDLRLTLAYEPQEYFHVAQTWALFVRRVGETRWIERPLKGLPRYHDRIGSRDQVFTDPHYPIQLHSIDLAVPPPAGGDALRSAAIRISGYLRYAHMQRRWRDGGDRLNPVLQVSVLPDHAQSRLLTLVAFDRTRSVSQEGMVRFVWLNDSSMLDTLPTDSRAVLHVEVPEAKLAFDVPINPEELAGNSGKFTRIEGTGFAYRIQNVQDNLVLPGGGNTVSVAIVGIKTPDGRFTRWVANRPEMTRDMHGEGADPHAGGARGPQKSDPRIRMTYHPKSAPILFAAHPRGLFLAVNGPEGRRLGREIKISELVEVVPGLSLRADALWTNAVSQVQPYVVPPASRRRDAGEAFSMIRVEIDTGHEIKTRWLRFNQYAFPNEQYAYAGRFTFAPEEFRLPDGSRVELMFSRQRRKLPNPIALEDFALDTHVGGYTGQVSTIRNYVSKLRFLDEGQWTATTSIRVNEPTGYGGYWYFQSMWDKPPAGDPSGGMNYTGLGVGNRNGVYIQLAGCCIAVTGMLFAFYVKPILKRRWYERSRAAADRAEGEEPDEFVAASATQTVEV